MKRLLRTAIAVVAVLSVTTFFLQAAVLRPHLWPAGAGMILSGGSLMAALAEPSVISVPVVPDPRPFLGRPVLVEQLTPEGTAVRSGLSAGNHVVALEDDKGRLVELGSAWPADPRPALELWRQIYRLSPTGPLTVHVEDEPGRPPRRVVVRRPGVWSLDAATFSEWLLQYHFGPLAKYVAYTLAGLLIVALGARGLSARLITLAFLLMGASDAGLLTGAEFRVPLAAPILLTFTWLLIPLTIPVISTAALHMPGRADWLEQYPWVAAAIWIVPVPLATVGLLATAFLLGVDATAPALAWLATHPAFFSLCFGVGLLTNVILVMDSVRRSWNLPDRTERRRMEVMIVTAVPGLAAYSLLSVPLLAGALGAPFRWPWPVSITLQAIVLASAVGVAWAVAVRRALSPRTVIRQGLQYAMARRTLAILTALPGLLLVISLVRQRDQPLAAIVEGRPLFYVTVLVLLILSLRFRDRGQHWLDRRFFRTEYDAREILVALAGRVPSEPDPAVLVRLVLGDIDTALHPEGVAVLADLGAGRYEPIHVLGPPPPPLRADGGLAQLLRWSDAPFEVIASDERSPAARLPTADREWLHAAGATLLVPIFAGTGAERPLVGIMALGAKRSEEPYTQEDRRLLAGIAAQMGLAADLWRLRRGMGTTPAGGGTPPAAQAAWAAGRGIDVGDTIDGKYRVDALVGRGGMGAVYRARDLRLERDVAVKVVRGELVSSPTARDRFQREARLAARLQHPAIVTVFDFGTLPDGSAYLVMEYVRGRDLRTRLSQGPFEISEGVRLLSVLAEAVAAAHREQVLHRDLKPENVLLTAQDGALKVLDFGVARLMAEAGADATQTSAGTVVGTPAYMAPEQLRGERVDTRADVYSLGVMGYEMLTGRLPFGAGSFIDVAVRQVETDRLPEMDDVPPAIAAVLARAMAYAADQRPETAELLAADLRRALDSGVRRPI